MKTQLLKTITLTLTAITFCFQLNAQTFTFTSSDEGFTKSANSTIVHNATAPGTLDITTGTGGNEGVILPGTIDADAMKYVQIVVKHTGVRSQMRMRIDGGTGKITIAPVNNGISTGDTAFQTYEFDFSANTDWVGTVSGVLLQWRQGGNNVGELIQLDSMTFSSTSLSTKQNTLEGVGVYPNPVTNILNIKSPVGSDITIYNVLGATVKTIKSADALQNVSVSSLKSGLYFVKVTNDGKIFQKKFIKN